MSTVTYDAFVYRVIEVDPSDTVQHTWSVQAVPAKITDKQITLKHPFHMREGKRFHPARMGIDFHPTRADALEAFDRGLQLDTERAERTIREARRATTWLQSEIAKTL